jgi:hypothetical protein
MKTILKILIILIASTLMIGTASAQIVTHNNIQVTLPDNLTVTETHIIPFANGDRIVINYGDEWAISYTAYNNEAEGKYLYNYSYGDSGIWYNVYEINYGQAVIKNDNGNAISVFHPKGAFIH